MSLEDKILKRNIPGRYSSWEEEGSLDVEEDSEEDEMDSSCYASKLHRPEFTIIHDESSSSSCPQYSSKSHRTGVKGILADYKHEKQNQEYIRNIEHLDHQLVHTTCPTTVQPFIQVSNTNHPKIEYDNDEEEDEMENDEEFLKTYREKRLLQLQEIQDWPIFGQVLQVNPIDFAEIVDALDPRVFCIIHLYEEEMSDCQVLKSHLSILAQRMPYCCFLQVQATAAKHDFDRIALPSVLIYRNRILVANLTPITAFLDRIHPTTTHHRLQSSSFTLDEIQYILESYGVLNPTSTANM